MQNTTTHQSPSHQAVYSAAGYLFYAIAACNRRISGAERITMDRLIKERWLPFERTTDAFGTDAAHYVTFAFERALDEHMDVDLAMTEFKEALREHASSFTREMRQLIWDTARSIAGAQAGVGKIEQVLLAELQRALGTMDRSTTP